MRNRTVIVLIWIMLLAAGFLSLVGVRCIFLQEVWERFQR